MAGSPLPEQTKSFILQHIHSVEQLEILLLLRERGGEWNPEQIARELRISELSTKARLTDLQLRGFLVAGSAGGSFRYEPAPETAELVAQVAHCYAQFRVSVINLIFSVPGDSARTLAEAFRIRKKESD